MSSPFDGMKAPGLFQQDPRVALNLALSKLAEMVSAQRLADLQAKWDAQDSLLIGVSDPVLIDRLEAPLVAVARDKAKEERLLESVKDYRLKVVNWASNEQEYVQAKVPLPPFPEMPADLTQYLATIQVA